MESGQPDIYLHIYYKKLTISGLYKWWIGE